MNTNLLFFINSSLKNQISFEIQGIFQINKICLFSFLLNKNYELVSIIFILNFAALETLIFVVKLNHTSFWRHFSKAIYRKWKKL